MHFSQSFVTHIIHIVTNKFCFSHQGPLAHVKTLLEWTSPVAVLWGTPTSSLKGSPSQRACLTSQTNTHGRPWKWSTCWGSTENSVTWCWWWAPRRFTLTVWSCRPAALTSGRRGDCGVMPTFLSVKPTELAGTVKCVFGWCFLGRCLRESWQRADRLKWWSGTSMRGPWSCLLTLPTPPR